MGFNRKLKRAKKKEQYERFSRAWQDEKRFQKYLVDVQGAVERDSDRKLDDGTYQREIVVPDGETVPALGRRPTFNMWNRAVDNQQKQTQADQDRRQVADVDDLSWEEESVRQNSHSTSETDVSS